jgi:uncharacterized protein YbaR (Trm112 family)
VPLPSPLLDALRAPLVCPRCRGTLVARDESTIQRLECPRCGVGFSVIEGVLDFLSPIETPE